MENNNNITHIVLQDNEVCISAEQWKLVEKESGKVIEAKEDEKLTITSHGRTIYIAAEDIWKEYYSIVSKELLVSNTGKASISVDQNMELVALNGNGWKISVLDIPSLSIEDEPNFNNEDDDDEENVMRALRSGNGDRFGF